MSSSSSQTPSEAPPGELFGVKALSTEKGRKAALSQIAARAFEGGTRDEVSGLTVAKQCVLAFQEMEKDRELPDRLSDLEAQLTEVKSAIAGRKGSALRSADAVVPPMEDSAIRTDMAFTPAAQGHREPHQS